MKTVSLLPPELKSRRLTQQRHTLFLRILTVFLALLIMVYIALFVSSMLMRRDLQSVQDLRANIQKDVDDLREYGLLYEQLINAEGLVLEVMGTVPLWSSLMQNITYNLPNGVWISEITASYEGDSGELELRGWAYDHDDVANMLEQVHTLEKLYDIRCQISAEAALEGSQVVQFVVRAQLNAGPSFLAVTEGGG